MAKSRLPKSPPLPEAVDHNKSWVIREPTFGSGVGLDYKSGVMTVPLAPTPHDRVVRNREMLRLKFSPKTMPQLPPDVDPGIYAACETARIDHRGQRLGVYHDTRMMTDEYIEEMSKQWKEKPQVAGAMMMMAKHTADFQPIAAQIYGMSKDGRLPPDAYYDITGAVGTALHYCARGKAPGPKQAIKAAQILTQMLAPPPPPPKDAQPDKGTAGPDGGEIAKDVKKGTQKMAQQMGERDIEAMIAEATYKHGSKPEMVRIESAQWGSMTIFEPPRPLIFPARLKSKKWRPTDQGSVFRYPNRWIADQTGFAYKGIKEGGCSMLIDVSGSMRLSQEDILTVMEYMPASLIATYSGNRESGKLTIVGKKGRRAEEHNFRTAGGNNLIDGPALRWLATQKGPRYWISDGCVTGIEGHTPRLYADAILICRQAHIMRIDSMAAVIEKFERYGYGKRRK